MAKQDLLYEPHLVLRELSLRPGEEWTPGPTGWWVIQISQGNGYCLQPRLNQELTPGTALVFAGQSQAVIRASLLGEASLCYFRVEPDRLLGLISSEEQKSLQAAATQEHLALRIFSSSDPISEKVKSLCAGGNAGTLNGRLQMLEIFIETLGAALNSQKSNSAKMGDAKERLAQLLSQIPATELADLSFPELAQKMRCTPRHLSRIFHELAGMSFREKQTQLRLTRARELLATTQAKILDVALDSGYQSQSLFNDLFKRRFGLSPARWRAHHSVGKPQPKTGADKGFVRPIKPHSVPRQQHGHSFSPAWVAKT